MTELNQRKRSALFAAAVFALLSVEFVLLDNLSQSRNVLPPAVPLTYGHATEIGGLEGKTAATRREDVKKRKTGSNQRHVLPTEKTTNFVVRQTVR